MAMNGTVPPWSIAKNSNWNLNHTLYMHQQCRFCLKHSTQDLQDSISTLRWSKSSRTFSTLIGLVPQLTSSIKEIVVLISYLSSISRIILLSRLCENLVPYIVLFLFAFVVFILSKKNMFFFLRKEWKK